ncbi:MAG TPA: DUF2061 domain-containing protein [Candidatus Saccharimonadales bacterium]|nr:DUF2061 domain-containing protein [Candidatus Saccharimonadales bacterium]
MKFSETKQRSIFKSITFRILIVCADLVVIYLITKKVSATIAITIITNLVSTTLYFLHERLWNGVSWGRRKSVGPK